MRRTWSWWVSFAWCIGMCISMAMADETKLPEPSSDFVVRFDFEDGTSQGWTVCEGAFGRWIGERDHEYHNETTPYVKQGRYYLTTLDNEDATVPNDGYMGVIESPVFTIVDDAAGNRATLLVGGGGKTRAAEEYVALVIVANSADSDTTDSDPADSEQTDQEVLFARGDDSQKLVSCEWNLTPWVGRAAYLRVVDQSAGGWGHIRLDDFCCAGRLEPQKTEQRNALRLSRELQSQYQPQLEALSAAIRELGLTEYETSFEQLDQRFQAMLKASGTSNEPTSDVTDVVTTETVSEAMNQWKCDFEALRKTVLITKNPLIAAHPIVYVERAQYLSDHHNTATIFQTGEINTASFRGGAALKVWDAATDTTRTIYALEEGGIRDPDISFDGTKILFSARQNRDDDWHMYEISANATPESPIGLRQITNGAGVSDIDPIYLPDGDFLFASTRDPKYCMCNRHIMCNLFRCGPNGENIHQITWNTLFDGHPTLLEDGRIIYDRWEYVDRNFGSGQGTWTINPDGTQPVVHYGNSTYSPGGVLDSRPIPGTQKVVSTFSSCHDLPWGAIAVIDRRRGVENRPGVERTWPAEAIQLVDVGDYDTFKRIYPRYEDPYPLSENFFLCSRMLGGESGDRMGLFLLDTFGNEILLHEDELGCFDPMPLAVRNAPPIIVPRSDFSRTDGEFFVQDVYEGASMRGVPRGSVKSLRVVASPEKRFWCGPAWDGGTGQQAPGMAWDDFNNKAILGTVPVEADGSAYFTVPAGLFVYFQALDADGRMIQTMRSGTSVQPGERTGCVGCHENRQGSVPLVAPAGLAGGVDKAGVSEANTAESADTADTSNASRALPMAVSREPSVLEPWYGPARNFSYRTEVQPVWDRYCVSCHDYGRPAGDVLNLSGDTNLIFNTSYTELRRKPEVGVKVIGAGPAPVLAAYTWGASQSPVAKVVQSGHANPANDRGFTMDAESVDRVLTWIDLNAPYYPEYATSFPEHPFGRAPITNEELNRLNQLMGLDLSRPENLILLSFTRPETSPALSKIPSDRSSDREEALEILRRGQRRFEATPGAEMPNFQLTRPEEISRQAKAERLRAADFQSRQQILSEQ